MVFDEAPHGTERDVRSSRWDRRAQLRPGRLARLAALSLPLISEDETGRLDRYRSIDGKEATPRAGVLLPDATVNPLFGAGSPRDASGCPSAGALDRRHEVDLTGVPTNRKASSEREPPNRTGTRHGLKKKREVIPKRSPGDACGRRGGGREQAPLDEASLDRYHHLVVVLVTLPGTLPWSFAYASAVLPVFVSSPTLPLPRPRRGSEPPPPTAAFFHLSCLCFPLFHHPVLLAPPPCLSPPRRRKGSPPAAGGAAKGVP